MSLGATTTHILCKDKDNGKSRLFGFGSSNYGQLGNGQSLTKHEPVEIALENGKEVTKISSGAFHSVCMTEDETLYGFGKCSKGQLAGGVSKLATKKQLGPVEIIDSSKLEPQK